MMELGLSLGASKPFTFMEKPSELPADLNTTLSIGPITTTISKSCEEEDEEHHHQEEPANKKENNTTTVKEDHEASTYKHSSASLSSSSKSNNNNSLQLHLLPHHSNPVPLSSFSWHPPSDNCDEVGGNSGRALKVKAKAEEEESEERTVVSSSPMSGASSFPVDLCIYSSNNTNNKGSSGNNYNNRKRLQNNNESEGEAGNYNYYDQRGCSSRASDEDDNNNVGGVHGCGTRKKLRLSKEQSAFLEESFKEHSTLNPKQKLALAKQLNLRPRQVEVWFQNRRARTKLKQTEVDCEYLKTCCETLSEENRRLQKELQELRALKASNSNPFFMKLPATTLTMCRSCERFAPNNSSSNNSNNNNNSASSSKPTISFPFAKPKFYPFPHSKPHQS